MLKKMDKLFDICYCMAKAEIPFTFFSSMCQCINKIGEGEISLGDTYLNDKQCAIFTDFISRVMFAKIVEKLRNASFFSLMIDESTNRANETSLIFFVKYFKPNSGFPTVTFLKLAHLKKADAVGITAAIENVFSEVCQFPDWGSKLISLGVDGAAVLVGKNSGVATRIQRNYPWLVTIHCLAHRLELSIKSSLGSSYMKTIESGLKSVNAFYRRSPKKYAQLKDIADILGESIVRTQRVDGTRWVAHHLRACEAMIRNWKIIVTHLSTVAADTDIGSEDRQTAKGIVKQISQYRFVMFLAYITDVLSVLSRLSLLLQQHDVILPQVVKRFDSTQAELIRLKDFEGPQLKSFTSNVSINIQSGDTCQYLDFKLKGKDSALRIFTNERPEIIDKVNEQLAMRFESLFNNVVIKASEVFDPSNWPRENLREYGLNEVQVLVDHFEAPLKKAGVDVLSISGEWHELKLNVKQYHKEDVCKGYKYFWNRIFLEKQGFYFNILALVQITQLFAISTSSCEVGFSFMNRIMSDWRSSLNMETLDALMRIDITGPTNDEFKPRPAVTCWWDDKVRHPERKPYGQRTSTDKSKE